MALLARSEELVLGSWVTITQGAKLKGVKYHTLRMWLRLHPEIETKRVGSVIVVQKSDIEEKYQPLR